MTTRDHTTFDHEDVGDGPNADGPNGDDREGDGSVDDGQPTGGARRPRRLPPPASGERRCMVLACTAEDTTAVDLETGAVLRLRIDWRGRRSQGVDPFDVVDVALAPDPEQDDQAQPEAVTVAGLPTVLGTCRGRRVRRVLRDLLAAGEEHLLGFPGSSAPYWEFDGMRPSVAVVVPHRGPVLLRRREDDTVWTRFGWNRSDNWLPLEDRRAVAELERARRDRLSGKDLERALGFRPQLIVVALSRPRDGHCYKTVAALLPRP